MIKPEMAPTVKVPAELAGGGGKAHRSGMSKSAGAAHGPRLPSATCPTTCPRKPCANTTGLTCCSKPPHPHQAVGNGNREGKTKGATLLLRKGNASFCS